MVEAVGKSAFPGAWCRILSGILGFGITRS
jgi:hypothetical protein